MHWFDALFRPVISIKDIAKNKEKSSIQISIMVPKRLEKTRLIVEISQNKEKIYYL